MFWSRRVELGEEIPEPKQFDYHTDEEWWQAVKIRRKQIDDGYLTLEEDHARKEAIRDCEFPNWHLAAHP